MTPLSHNQRGFTLLEVIFYIALLTVIMGSGLAATYNIIEGTEKTNAHVIIEEEGNFLLRKVEWVLTGISTINSPAPGNSGATLSVNKISYTQNPIVLDITDGKLRIKKNSVSPVILNSDAVAVSSLSFEHLPAAGGKPAAIHAQFLVNNQLFETTRYLRK